MMAYLDTNCVIYLVEQNPVWGPKILSRIVSLRQGGDQIATSDLSRTECLARPFFTGDAAVIADYQAFFADTEVQMLSLTAGVCLRAAQLRAASQFALQVPDCLHLATAIEHGCGLFLTNDTQLRRCTQIQVEILR